MVPGGQSLTVGRELLRENLIRRLAGDGSFSWAIGIGQVPKHYGITMSMVIVTTTGQPPAVRGQSHRPRIFEDVGLGKRLLRPRQEVPKNNGAIGVACDQ